MNVLKESSLPKIQTLVEDLRSSLLSVEFPCSSVADYLIVKRERVEFKDHGVYQCVNVCELLWFYETKHLLHTVCTNL